MTRPRTLPALLLALALPAAVHATTYVASPSGDDTAAGNAAAPFRTISRAAQAAMPGDTVLVQPGIYRERVSPPRGGTPGKPITYRAEQLGRVFIKGSDLWQPDWQRHNDAVHFGVVNEALFTDDVYLDSPNPFRVPLASTPHGRNGRLEQERFGYGDPKLSYNCGQVFVNGQMFTQVPFLAEVETQPNSWTFDPPTGRIYIHFGNQHPAGQTVEITTRRRIFAPHLRGLGHIVVEGFVLEHCGNQYPTNFWNTPVWGQAGALGFRQGHHWIVRLNMIRYANTVAIDAGFRGGSNEPAPSAEQDESLLGCDNLIEENYLVDNGAAGIIGSGSLRLTVRGNVILRNNTLGFTGNKRYEHAGIKCHGMRDGLIESNYIADNPTNDGVWLDNQFPGTRVTRNVIVGNGNRGIFLEMSDYPWDTALVDHNIVVDNRVIQFYVHDASGSTVMHNLFANSPADSRHGQGAYIYQVTARTRTYHHSLFNNFFVNHRVMLDIAYPSHRAGPQRLDHNVYDAAPTDRTFLINSACERPSPWNPTEFIDLVHRDLGAAAPGHSVIDGEKKALLTLDEWRAFWQQHNLPNDRHSVTQQGMAVSYDPATYELTVNIPFDPHTIGSTNHHWIDTDFRHQPVPQDGTAMPGPFQNLRQGRSVFCVWDGLPVLAKGELPK